MAIDLPIALSEIATNIISAVIILLLGFVAGKIAGKILGKFFTTFASKKKKNILLARNIAKYVSIIIYIAAVILALEEIGITIIVLEILLTIISILIIGAVFFSVLNFIANLFFGIRIITTKKFQEGDIVKIRKINGTITKIGLASTTIKTPNGEKFVLFNRLFFKYKFSREKKETNADKISNIKK